MGILLGGSQESVPIVEKRYTWEETGFVKFAVYECDAWNCGSYLGIRKEIGLWRPGEGCLRGKIEGILSLWRGLWDA